MIATEVSNVQFLSIDIAFIRESEDNPRRYFDPKALDELTASVKQSGVLTPILVRPSAGKYEIAAGHRRYRAAKAAGLLQVPAIVRQMDDQTFLEILTIENLQREDIHPLDEASGYHKLIVAHGYTADILAEKVGKSPAYVYARLKLSDLMPELQARFLEDKITLGHALLLARLPEPAQIEAAKEGLLERRWNPRSGSQESVLVSVGELDQWIREHITLDLKKAPFSIKDPNILPAAGACVECPKRSGHAPKLFADLGKSDHCLDRHCFEKKIDASIKARIDAGKAIALTTDYQNKELPRFYETPDASGNDKKCAHAVTGIAIDGPRKGETRKVCLEKSCKVHYGKRGSSAGANDTWQREQARKQKAAKAETEFRRSVHVQLCGLVDADEEIVLTGSALIAVADAVFDRLEHTERKQVERFTEDVEPEKYFKQAGSEALLKLVIKMVAMRELRQSPYLVESKREVELFAIAKQFGVPVDKMRKDQAPAKKSKAGKKPAAKARKR